MHCYIDQSICIKCGLCEGDMFKLDNVGNYQFKLPEIKDSDIETLRDLQKKCPVDAIIVEE